MSCKIVDYCKEEIAWAQDYCEDDRLHCWVKAHKKMLDFIVITQFYKNRIGELRIPKDVFYAEYAEHCKEHGHDAVIENVFYEELGRVVLWKEYREFDVHPFSNERSWFIYLPIEDKTDRPIKKAQHIRIEKTYQENLWSGSSEVSCEYSKLH